MNFHEQIHWGHSCSDVLWKKRWNKWFTFRKVIIFLPKGHRGYKVILKYNQARQQMQKQHPTAGEWVKETETEHNAVFSAKVFPSKNIYSSLRIA